MASVRQTRTGAWELTIRHPDLPGGRRFLTYKSEDDAREFGRQWDLLVEAGLPVPANLLADRAAQPGASLGSVIRAWANSGHAAPTDQATLTLLITEVGATKLSDATYAWVEHWVQTLKVDRNLAPSSIKKRVSSLSRAIDYHLRKTPDLQIANPIKLLPKGYARYNERDAALLKAANAQAPDGAKELTVKEDIDRERRLHEGEEEKIVSACTDPELLMLFYVIVYTGLRLKEAYTLRKEQVLLDAKIIRAKKSKLWRGKVAYKDVPIRPELFALVKDFIESAPPGLLFGFWDGEETIKSHAGVSSRLSQRFSTLFRRAGCEGLTEHDLRHEATCRWLEMRDEKGAWVFRDEEVNRIMGWSPGSKMSLRYASFRGASLSSRLWGQAQSEQLVE